METAVQSVEVEKSSKRDEDRKSIIRNRINTLRTKLLDLTKNNPLISTKFSDRSTFIRVVDEVPELLLESILKQKMRIAPLPALDSEPKDEATREFQSALAEARINDETYKIQLDQIDQECDEAADQFAQIERRLKDKLRELLNMPPRQINAGNLSLDQHAKNHGILPNYELPFRHEIHEDGRHVDKDIQTLLLPDALERRLNALFTKEKTYREETGISVLQMAFGFLEWEESNNSKTQFSPLILLPVQLEKANTRSGPEFSLFCDETEAKGNMVLAEKLKQDFNIVLPEYDGEQDLEEYLSSINEEKPKGMTWKVRRRVVIGTFPSSRLAMYNDLDPNKFDFSEHQVISTIFGGSDTSNTGSPFGDEYDVEHPSIECKIPHIISDADSSQLSAIVDVLDGKNLAVEGPPGTGKSQTIVNTIAAALAVGKKVLFVAEKSAALEVVNSRLEAYGLGKFVLPLQAKRSNKEQVYASIKTRLETPHVVEPADMIVTISKLKEIRAKLNNYVGILSAKYRQTDFTIHEVMGRYIKESSFLEEIPEDLKNIEIPDDKNLTKFKLTEILAIAKQIDEIRLNIRNFPTCWKLIRISNVDPFLSKELLGLAADSSSLFLEVFKLRQNLANFNVEPSAKLEELNRYLNLIDSVPVGLNPTDFETIERLKTKSEIESVQIYLNAVEMWRIREKKYKAMLSIEPQYSVLESVSLLAQLIKKHEFSSINIQTLDAYYLNHAKTLEGLKESKAVLDQASKVSKVFLGLPISDLIQVLEIIASTSRSTLLLRSNQLDDPLIQSSLSKQIFLQEALLKKKELLECNFVITGLPDLQTLRTHTATLAASSIFSFFSSEYRAAKKFYKSICRKSEFNQKIATSHLQELTEWLSESHVFQENPILKELLGDHLNGLETDLKPYQDALEFFRVIDKSFNGSEHLELKLFLKTGNINEITMLRGIDKKQSLHSYSELKCIDLIDRACALESELIELKADLKKINELKNIFRSPESLSNTEIYDLASDFGPFLEIQKELRANMHLQVLLGTHFKAEQTCKEDLTLFLEFANLLLNFQQKEKIVFISNAKKSDLSNLREYILAIVAAESEAFTALENIAKKTNSNPLDWFLLANESFLELSEMMKVASLDKDGLAAYSKLVFSKNKLSEFGYESVADTIMLGEIESLYKTIESIIILKMARSIFLIHPSLSSFDGVSLQNLRERYQKLDKKIIQLSRIHLQSLLYSSARPPRGIGVGRKSEYTELKLIENEVSKKQRYIPVRELTQRATKALTEIKPCWMMSPLAVAQYLPKGLIEFDLLIIDEASQMTPEDSVGALVRAKQSMIVGDTNQLPPSDFFKKILDNDSVDEDENVTEESILEMANACFRPARRLKWHYRSRHSGLISFSNKHVYDNDLVIFPSANENHPDMGVSYVPVEGLYSSGTNAIEAAAMIDAIVEFMEKYKNKSLGVVLLNQKQRDIVMEEFNYAIGTNPHVREYLDNWEIKNDGLESFFIKNLENVQGDERDVIFIGTVYGPAQIGGPVLQRFGPINGISGKRRLNVLFSRAKERIVTFSSMSGSDIQADENGNVGAYMLKLWLDYSASGILESGTISGKEADSDFEEHVIHQIKSIGYEAIPQIGVKKFSIDIGVRYPSWSHGFILGVECDGATYHSSRSARDRDRLRQEILEGLGWKLYRIWSTDWFEDPIRESQKLRNAIESRVEELIASRKFSALLT